MCYCRSISRQNIRIGDEPLLIVQELRFDSSTDKKNGQVMTSFKSGRKVLDFLEEKGLKYVCGSKRT